MDFYKKTTREVRGKFSLRGVGEVRVDGIEYGVCGLLGFDTENPAQIRIVEHPETVYVEAYQGTKRGTVNLADIGEGSALLGFGNGQKVYIQKAVIASPLMDYETVATEYLASNNREALYTKLKLFDGFITSRGMIPANQDIGSDGPDEYVIRQIIH